VFDSSKTPGEILDLLVINTKVLAENPDLGKALVGAWYETMALMQAETAEAEAALTAMATASGTDLDTFKSQLATTHMYWTPAEALEAYNSEELMKTNDMVRNFSFEKGLLGEGAASADAVGIEFPGMKTLGNAGNVTMRFDPTYVQMAADGTL